MAVRSAAPTGTGPLCVHSVATSEHPPYQGQGHAHLSLNVEPNTCLWLVPFLHIGSQRRLNTSHHDREPSQHSLRSDKGTRILETSVSPSVTAPADRPCVSDCIENGQTNVSVSDTLLTDNHPLLKGIN